MSNDPTNALTDRAIRSHSRHAPDHDPSVYGNGQSSALHDCLYRSPSGDGSDRRAINQAPDHIAALYDHPRQDFFEQLSGYRLPYVEIFQGDRVVAAPPRSERPSIQDQQIQMAKQSLLCANFSATDKIAAVEWLGKQGVEHFQLPDRDGRMRDYSIETQNLNNNKSLVHLFADGNDGKPHVVLRALSHGDGTFEQQRSNNGERVSYAGTWWSQNMSGTSTVTGFNDASGPQSGPPDWHRGIPSDSLELRRPAPYYRPEIPSSVEQRNRPSTDDSTNRYNSNDAAKLAHDAEAVARQMGSVGWCFRGVSRALDRSGVHVQGRYAYMAKAQLEQNPRFAKVLETDHLNERDLRPGDVIVHPQYSVGGGIAGHIAVYLGNGREASDHIQRLIGGRAAVFRLRGNASGGNAPDGDNLQAAETQPQSQRRPPSIYHQYLDERERYDRMHPRIDGFQQPDNQAVGAILDRANSESGGAIGALRRTSQGVYMHSRFDVDADGYPSARRIDPDGQLDTSMRYTTGGSINANEVPYFVLPGGKYQQFGIRTGDFAIVRNRENGRVAVAVFADVG
ncbi:MAG: hypothetical protein ACRD3W_17125, partial [Terriglobales bacterium]